MRSRLVSVFVAAFLLGLSACMDGGLQGSLPQPAPSTVVLQPTPGLTPKERNIKALGLLEQGKRDEARVELVASLADAPAERNALAQNLLSQIDDDPVAMLGTANFTHTVDKGESLSAISERYLGDKFKFYALARYNGIENPSLLQAGTKIKVPGKQPPKVAAAPAKPAAEPTTPPKEPEVAAAAPANPPETAAPAAPVAAETDKVEPETPAPPKSETVAVAAPVATLTPEEQATERKMKLFAAARERSDAGNYPGAIEIIEDGLSQFPQDQMFKVYGADVYEKHGGSLLEKHKYPEALAAVERGAALNPENRDLAKRIEDAKKGVRADGLYHDGQKYEASRAYIEAYESYQAALKVWPRHEPAQIALAKVRPEVADKYYREARTAFQQHDLEKALEYYDKTLEIDSSHEPAKLERQRTIQLIDKLKQAG